MRWDQELSPGYRANPATKTANRELAPSLDARMREVQACLMFIVLT
jgi:hypothetical protein